MKKIVLSLILIFILVCFSSPTVVNAAGINNSDQKNHENTPIKSKNTNNSDKEKVNSEINDIDFGPYIKMVQRKIRENWDPPNGKENCRAVARFKINKDGTINGIKILKSSGNESYDNASIMAISKSSPAGALPINFKRNYIEIEFHFDYHVAR